jgi:hypothetical protein
VAKSNRTKIFSSHYEEKQKEAINFEGRYEKRKRTKRQFGDDIFIGQSGYIFRHECKLKNAIDVPSIMWNIEY